MSSNKNKKNRAPRPPRDERLFIRSVLRQPLDEQKAARAFLAIALNEAAAQAEHEQRIKREGQTPGEAA